jgi:hypothetical protein
MSAYAVDVDIPYGNACLVEIDDGADPVRLLFSPHPHGGTEALWFCFRVERAEGARDVTLVLRNPQNLLGAGDLARLRPVIRRAGADWERMPPAEVEQSPDGRRHAAWTVRAPAMHFDIAFCYPYGDPEVEQLADGSGGRLRLDEIGASQEGRPMLRIANGPGLPGEERPGVYLVARQHSGETPGSWVLDGFLREVASLGEAAPMAWAVPLADVDGVERGDYGKDGYPYDLNRGWGRPPMRHETLVIQRDVDLWRTRCRPALALDFHAPGACESEGVYAYFPDNYDEARIRQDRWASALAEALREYAAAEFGRVARYPSRWETPHFTDYCRETLDVAALSVETPYALCGEILMTRERYREVGSRIARAVSGRLRRADD